MWIGIVIGSVATIAIGAGVFLHELGRFCEDICPQEFDEIKWADDNPNMYCFNTCCENECYKHKNNCDYSKHYVFAFLKDTPYCPYYEKGNDDE